ncbi:MAG: (2Fe-2S)-binding protein [Pseudanabaenaceae cyanobacterium bins.39]|nr:(2Fe-2S)-binding protein [Pseudanabaenaceae cyanobacterium bins.39]
MYVCICQAITEKDIQEAVNKGASSVTMLSELTLLGKHCGCCTEEAHRVLSQCSSKPTAK